MRTRIYTFAGYMSSAERAYRERVCGKDLDTRRREIRFFFFF